jgi:hypothetical protein
MVISERDRAIVGLLLAILFTASLGVSIPRSAAINGANSPTTTTPSVSATMGEGPTVTVTVYSKNGTAMIPWACLWQPPNGTNDPYAICDGNHLRKITIILYDEDGTEHASDTSSLDPWAMNYSALFTSLESGKTYSVGAFVTGYVMTDEDAYQRTFTLSGDAMMVAMDLRRSNWFMIAAHTFEPNNLMTIVYEAVNAKGELKGLVTYEIPASKFAKSIILEGFNGAADYRDFGFDPGSYEIRVTGAEQIPLVIGEPTNGSITLGNSPRIISFAVALAYLGMGGIQGNVLAIDSFGSMVPLAGALVEAKGQQGTFTTTTWSDGTIALALPTGSCDVTASASGYAPESYTSVFIAEGLKASVDFVLATSTSSSATSTSTSTTSASTTYTTATSRTTTSTSRTTTSATVTETSGQTALQPFNIQFAYNEGDGFAQKYTFSGFYYVAPNSRELVLIIPGGSIYDARYICIMDTGPTSFAADLAINYGFDVAIAQMGCFHTGTSFEINGIIKELAKMYGEKQVFLIGHSAGGAAVASYVTSQPSNSLVQAAVVLDAPLAANPEEEVDWTLNGLLNSAYRARDLTIPTLLVYGENDFVHDRQEWFDRAPANLTGIELYSYEHDPWDSGVDTAVRTQVEQRIIRCIVKLYCLIPEMPYPTLAFIPTLLAIVVLRRRKNVCVMSSSDSTTLCSFTKRLRLGRIHTNHKCR